MNRLTGTTKATTPVTCAGVIGVMILACSSASSAARPQLPPLPSMACPVISANDAPRIDGTLDEPIWEEGDVQTRFYRHYGGNDGKLEFRMICDGKWLYIAGAAYETAIPAKDQEHISLFIAPSKAWDHFVSFSISMNAHGITKRRVKGFEEGNDNDWRVAFAQHKDRWVIEIAIRIGPVFGKKISEGQAFDFNFKISQTSFFI